MSEFPVSLLSHHPINRSIYSLSSIDALMHSIDEMGLLQPLVIDQNNHVISGNRRLKAIQNLGWKSVSVEQISVADDEVVPLIISYNHQRVKTNKEVLQEYRAMEKAIGAGQGRRNDLLNPTWGQTTPSGRNPKTRDIIAEKVGVSSTKLGRLLFIHNNNPKYIDLIDDGELTINKAYQHLQDGKYTFAYGENRNPNDFYNTPYRMTEQLLQLEDFDKELSVCEPATGNDGITNVLHRNWKPELITSYDMERDFFQDTNSYDYIITNPPFSQAIEFINQAKLLAKNKFCLLLPLNYLHGKKRYEEVYKDTLYGLARVHVFTRSILMNDEPIRTDGKAKGGMLVFAWYVFENGYREAPQITWIDNGADIY